MIGSAQVIYPEEPLFLVDKSFRHRKSRSSPGGDNGTRSSTGGSVQENHFTFQISKLKSSPDATCCLTDVRQRHSARPRPQPVLRGFQFVNSRSSSTAVDIDSKRLIRSHARREVVYRNATRSARERQAHCLKASTGSTDDSFNSHKPTHDRWYTPSSSPSRSISPYGAVSVEIKPQHHQYLSYYLNVVAHATYPLEKHLAFNPLKSRWFPIATTDGVLSKAIIYAAILHHAHRKRSSVPDEGHAQLALLLPELHSRLATSIISEASIGAVCCLAMVENMFGRHEKARLHLQGLANMIKQRGGMSTIEETLQLKICKADVELAIDSASEALLPPLTRSHPPITFILDDEERGSSSLDPQLVSCVDSLLIPMLSDLRQLCVSIGYLKAHPSISIHPRVFDEATTLLQHSSLKRSTTMLNAISQAMRLTALIVLKSITREMPYTKRSSSLLGSALYREILSIHMDKSVPLALRLWVMVFCGMVTELAGQREAVRNQMEAMLALAGFKTGWLEVRSMLKEVAWVDGIHEEAGREFWEDSFEGVQQLG